MEDCTSHRYSLIPPPSPQDKPDLSNSMAVFAQSDERNDIDEFAVREALRKEARKHKYWKANVARRMQIENIETSNCFHYALESFTEMRCTSKATEGATLGQFLHHKLAEEPSQRLLNPWSCEIEPGELFVEQMKLIEMPGTSDLSACTTCSAEGKTHCFFCRGYGSDKCAICRGTGMKSGVAHPAIYTHPLIGTFPHSDISRGYSSSGTAVVRPTSGGLAYGIGTPIHFMNKAGLPPPGIGHHDLCPFCHGRGIRGCLHCEGNGKKTCSTCGGSGSMRTFIKLRLQFVVRSDYYVPCDISEELLKNVSGRTIMNETNRFVTPIGKFKVASINENSRKFCATHLEKCFERCRIIKQRHYLESIPIARVQYKHGSNEGVFWVYGNEHLCYIPSYPAKCCIL